MTMIYVPLSECGGVIVDDVTSIAYILDHIGNEIVAAPIKKDQRPTICNKEFFDSFIKEFKARGTMHQPEIHTPISEKNATIPYKYGYMLGDSGKLSPEYQLYLAGELERALIQKASTIKGAANTLQELTGLLPHEEEQDEH